MGKKDIFTIIVIGAILIFNFYLGGIISILESIVFLGIYIIIFYGIYATWKIFRKKEYLNIYAYSRKFLYSVSWVFLIIFGIIGTFAYYYNEISPAVMPEYTLTNGKKTVKFQAMIHIGTQNFYDEILSELIEFKKNNGVYFFEGVRPGSPENMEKFNEALGIEFSSDLYKNFSKLYGVTFQDTEQFLGHINDLDFNVDLNIDDIMNLYDDKVKETKKEVSNAKPIDVNSQVLDLLSQTKEKELKIIVYINQSILNFLMNYKSILTNMANTFHNKEFFEVILGERNKVLVDAIENSKYEQIFVTYGLIHFDGVYELLKEKDPNREIIEVKNLYPIK